MKYWITLAEAKLITDKAESTIRRFISRHKGNPNIIKKEDNVYLINSRELGRTYSIDFNMLKTGNSDWERREPMHDREIEKAELILKKKEMDLYENLIKTQVKKPFYKITSLWVTITAIIVIAAIIFAGSLYRKELIINRINELASSEQKYAKDIESLEKNHTKEIESLGKNHTKETTNLQVQFKQLGKQQRETIDLIKKNNERSMNALQSALDSSIEQNKQLNKTNEYLKYIIAGLSQKLDADT